MYTDRIMGLLLDTTSSKCVLLNVRLRYEQGTSQGLQDYLSRTDNLSKYLSDSCFDDINLNETLPVTLIKGVSFVSSKTRRLDITYYVVS